MHITFDTRYAVSSADLVFALRHMADRIDAGIVMGPIRLPDDRIIGAFSVPDPGDLGEFDADEQEFEEHDPFRDDVEADADALASIGWGTDEDYGAFEDAFDYDYGALDD